MKTQTYHKLLQTGLKQLIVDTYPPRVFDWRQRVLNYILDETVDIYLLQRDPHRARFSVGEHYKLDIGGGLIVMELVLRGSVGKETVFYVQYNSDLSTGRWDLSSSPPSLRTMFRREKTVPNISFASSSALRTERAWPPPFTYAWEEGREVLPAEEIEGGSHRFLYMHSAMAISQSGIQSRGVKLYILPCRSKM